MYSMHEYEFLRQHNEKMKQAEKNYHLHADRINRPAEHSYSKLLKQKIAALLIYGGRIMVRRGLRLRYSVAR